MKKYKLSYRRRPTRIHIRFYCSYTGNTIHVLNWPYQPLMMLNGQYRKIYNKLKVILPPLYKGDLLHGKMLGMVTFTY